MSFKEFLNESKAIRRNGQSREWEMPKLAKQYIDRVGGNIIGRGITKKIWDTMKAESEFIFFELWSNEKHLEKQFKENNKNKSEVLCRYVSNTTAISGMAPLCILNADKGYMRFLDNIDEDPSDMEYFEWSKPEKFQWLDVTF